jgi:hypothetical protein
MKPTELLDYENFPRLCLAIGTGLLYYFAYLGARLALSTLIALLPSILPWEFFIDPVSGERLSVTITLNTLEFMIAAVAVGIVISILLIYLFRDQNRYFGSIAILVYVFVTEGLLAWRLLSQSRPTETWVLVFKIVRPLAVSVVFYVVLAFALKYAANHGLQRIMEKGKIQKA